MYGMSNAARYGLETEFDDNPKEQSKAAKYGLAVEFDPVDAPPQVAPAYATDKGRHGNVQADGSVKWEGGSPGGLADMVGGSGAGLGPIGALIGPLMAYKSHLDKVTNRKYKATAKDYAQMAFPAQAGLFGKQGQAAPMRRGHAKTGGIGGLFGQ